MRYKDTRADDSLIGTIADDVFKISRGGIDTVDGGGGFDRLEVDYHTGRIADSVNDEVTIAADGSMFGRLYDVATEHGRRSYVSFTGIDQLAFVGTGGLDFLEITVGGQVSDKTVHVDLGGGGSDVLTLSFDNVRAQTVNSSADGTVTTSIGTFIRVDHLNLSLSKYGDVANLGMGTGSLFGNNGDDRLTGSDGGDLIGGGKGADVLAGGLGADTFQYDDVRESSAVKPDTILDFSHAEGDVIRLHVDTDPATPRRQAFVFIDQQQFTGPGGTHGELRQQDNGDGTVTLQGDTNHDGVADFVILIHTDTLLVKTDLFL